MLDRLTIERMTASAGDRPILIALSGGGDSAALLHLLVERLGAASLRAAIVDHGLRPGSAEDAQRALAFARALGVGAEILTLSWPENANRAQQAARAARYAALCGHARKTGAGVIAAAHTADDQAETVLMRAAAGSTWLGLAGMAPLAAAPLWPEGRGVVIARPLLGVRREPLRALLRQRGAEWIEDPANANPAFERVRVRARLANLEVSGFDPMRLARLAASLRVRADRLDRAASSLIAQAARVGREVRVDRTLWRGPDEVRRRALAALAAAAAGAARAPSMLAMVELERRVMAPGYQGGTHSGARFSPSGVELRITRDPGAALGRGDGAPALAPLPLAVGEEVVWDGRWAFTARVPGWRAVADNNADLVSLEKDGEKRAINAAKGVADARALALERLRHAFALQVNDAQPS